GVGMATYAYGDITRGRGWSTFKRISAYGYTYAEGIKPERAELGRVSHENGMRIIGGVSEIVPMAPSALNVINALRRSNARQLASLPPGTVMAGLGGGSLRAARRQVAELFLRKQGIDPNSLTGKGNESQSTVLTFTNFSPKSTSSIF
ncbi:hypothetical protein N9933_03125, partial [bacterium]|nr:hypothetical protein [bacterium]